MTRLASSLLALALLAGTAQAEPATLYAQGARSGGTTLTFGPYPTPALVMLRGYLRRATAPVADLRVTIYEGAYVGMENTDRSVAVTGAAGTFYLPAGAAKRYRVVGAASFPDQPGVVATAYLRVTYQVLAVEAAP